MPISVSIVSGKLQKTKISIFGTVAVSSWSFKKKIESYNKSYESCGSARKGQDITSLSGWNGRVGQYL